MTRSEPVPARATPAAATTAPTPLQRAVDLVGFQLVWWTSALVDGGGRVPGAGVIALVLFGALHVALVPRGTRAARLLLSAVAAALGVLTDGALVATGAIAFPATTTLVGASPPWMVALWAGFALTIPSTLAPLTSTPLRAAAVGAVAGPLSYLAGSRVDALVVGPDGSVARALVAIAVAWALALALLAPLARACVALPTTPATLRRRLITIPALFVACVALGPLLVALLPLALLVDVLRRFTTRTPPTVARLFAFIAFYLLAEIVGLAALFVGWWWAAGDARALVASTARVQRVWAGALFGFVRRVFALRIDAEGLDVVSPGPVLVLVRHASIVDTLLPTVFVSGRSRMLLKFVLKRELLSDPCLDVAGLRLPNHFVARDGKDSAGEIAAVRALADELGPDEGVLVYPEGTRFTPARRAAALARIDDPALAARASALQHVLPPRTGGVLGLLDARTPADVVFFAHHGLDGLSLFDDLWRGGLVGRVVSLHLWRVPRAAIPGTREARVAWLFDQWTLVDAWIAARAGGAPGAPPSGDTTSTPEAARTTS